jgi:peptide/nickel transport system substrate-binding protein
MDYHFGSGCTAALGKCYPEIADAISRGGATTDDAARQAAYTEANNKIRELVPLVPLDHGGAANAYLAGVGNPQFAAFGSEHLFSMTPPQGSDNFILMQTGEPASLFCQDETDGEALRACEQVMEGLYGYTGKSLDAVPALATKCTPNDALDQWTCNLRPGVKFHDGSTFEAKDVLVSFASMWDAALSTHVGATSTYEYWTGLFGNFLNPPAPCGIQGQPACP